jgi:hypothetical protein
VYKKGETEMKVYQSVFCLCIVAAISNACDDQMSRDMDASAVESCEVYLDLDSHGTDGSGSSKEHPLGSVDAALKKALELKKSCGVNTEVRVVSDSFDSDQLDLIREVFASAGIRFLDDTASIVEHRSDGEGNSSLVGKVNGTIGSGYARTSSSFEEIGENRIVEDDKWVVRSDSTNDYYSVDGANPYLRLNADSSNYVDWIIRNYNGNLFVRRSTSGGTGGERVGIGVHENNGAPASRLVIDGFENSGLKDGSGVLRIVDGTHTLLLDGDEIDNFGNHLYLNRNSNRNVIMFPDSTSAMVGIGTWHPTHMLTVRGAVKAEELVIDTVGADFVFEDEYKLRSLEDVESFVAENNHLPEIPSAAEMQSQGAKIGELSIKLLQKVEELTLYTIEQQKRMAAIEKENQRLAGMVKSLVSEK